ncbi:hypothetical protein [Acutalibacter intestini]|uniref:hypothetical protein n=1 Tax=Acutalibacter intestini TaxID=3093659 RepID=UPI002AC9231D|nr:hypothetical protein [Acutalibacter sp. M00204]
MKRQHYRPRMIDKTLQEYLATFGAVCVDGQKWCGTTWNLSCHDGAGRNGKLRMRPASLYEFGDSSRQHCCPRDI